MKAIVFICILWVNFLSPDLYAQDIDMTGTWEVITEDHYGEGEIKLIQTGETIIGECFYPKAGVKSKISATMTAQHQVIGIERFHGTNYSFRWDVRKTSFHGHITKEKPNVRMVIRGSKKSSSIPVFSYR